MTGPEHYRASERCREKAMQAQNAAYDGGTECGWEKAAYWNAAAQVHATLALAAATADAGPVKDWLGDESKAGCDWAAVV